MIEFSTRINRSLRFVRTIQFFGSAMISLSLVMYLVYMVVMTKALVEAGEWVLTLAIIPWIPLVCFLMFMAFLPMLERPFTHIRITQEGVWLRRPLHRERLIPWGAFQEMCLIDDDLPRYNRQQPASLLMVKWEALRKRSGEWNNTSTTHADRIISVDFDAEVRAALRELCPHPIVDHRKHINGKHCSTT